jgi:hypothetical protein
MTGVRKFTLSVLALVLTLAFAAWAPGITEAARLRALQLAEFEFGAAILGHVASDLVKRPAGGRQTEGGTK